MHYARKGFHNRKCMKHLEVYAKKLGIQISVYCNPKNHAAIYHFTSFNCVQNDTRSDHASLLEAETDRVVFFSWFTCAQIYQFFQSA